MSICNMEHSQSFYLLDDKIWSGSNVLYCTVLYKIGPKLVLFTLPKIFKSLLKIYTKSTKCALLH